MEYSDGRTTSPITVSIPSSCIPSTSSSQIPQSLSPPRLIMSPCAACKILRRRCVDNCVLAPYFPPTDPLRFIIAHKVFGAGNVIKLLQEIPECQRADTVSSIVYEANARIRDPVYGCTGVIYHLQKQVSELGAELAKTQAQLVAMQCQQTNLLALDCMDISLSQQQLHQLPPSDNNSGFSFDDRNSSPAWEPLWT